MENGLHASIEVFGLNHRQALLIHILLDELYFVMLIA